MQTDFYKCDQPGFSYETKRANNLKRHKANIHNIGVTWHRCDQPGCSYEAKNTDSYPKKFSKIEAYAGYCLKIAKNKI